MNLEILAVQSLVNSFGTVVMATFATAVKIDSFAYMPLQDFGNAFFGVRGIWLSVLIGWVLADFCGLLFYYFYRKTNACK